MKKLGVVLVILLLSAGIASGKATIGFNKASISTDPGDTIKLEILVDPKEKCDTVAVDLITWDKDVLECTDIEQGDLFSDSTIWIGGKIRNEEGKIKDICWGSTESTADDGVFVTITFNILKAKDTTIVIDPDNVGVARAGNSIDAEVTQNCDIIVTGSSSIFTPNGEDGLGALETLTIIGAVITVCLIVLVIMKKKKGTKKVKKESKATVKSSSVKHDVFK